MIYLLNHSNVPYHICLIVKLSEGKGRNRGLPNHCSNVSLFFMWTPACSRVLTYSQVSWVMNSPDRSSLDWLRKTLQEPPRALVVKTMIFPCRKPINLSMKSHLTNLNPLFAKPHSFQIFPARGPILPKDWVFQASPSHIRGTAPWTERWKPCRSASCAMAYPQSNIGWTSSIYRCVSP